MEIREQIPGQSAKLLTEFTQHLRAEGKSKSTIEAYSIAVAQFLTHIKHDLKRISQKTMDNFFAEYSSQIQTQNQKKNAIKKFLSFLDTNKHIRYHLHIKTKDVRRPDPEYLTLDEQDKLIQYVRGLGEYSKPFTIIKTLLLTGLRVSELINLKFSDVHESGLTLRDPKSRSTRRKRIKREIGAMLKKFMKARRTQWPLNNAPAGSNDYLFMTHHKGQYKSYTRQAISAMVKKYAREIGITKKISPHTLRHSFAYRYLQAGGALKGLQRQLNHAGIESTEIYLHISDEQEQEELERL
jgi:integrase/recombinase XerD